jgi:hypothetical protein
LKIRDWREIQIFKNLKSQLKNRKLQTRLSRRL